ncbi:MAG: ATP-binding cassette domain-containing protein, partial [Cyanobacteria bacterium J06638_20]
MLRVQDLVYHPAATPTPILDGVSLELEPKQMGVIIGPSGSGKSTLLEILSGLAKQTAGSIKWRDQDLTPDDLRQMGGLVFQFPER